MDAAAHDEETEALNPRANGLGPWPTRLLNLVSIRAGRLLTYLHAFTHSYCPPSCTSFHQKQGQSQVERSLRSFHIRSSAKIALRAPLMLQGPTGSAGAAQISVTGTCGHRSFASASSGAAARRRERDPHRAQQRPSTDGDHAAAADTRQASTPNRQGRSAASQ